MWNACNPKDEIPEKNFKRLELTIPHKSGESRLIAVSSNPDAAAGKGGSLIIDELALHRDPERLMSVAQPIIMSGGRLSVLSTHRSRNSLFNRLVKEAKKPDSEWEHHATTIYDAVDQGLVELIVNPKMVKMGNEPYESRDAFINWLKSTYDEHTFSQEFCCIPADDACSLLAVAEVERAEERLEKEGHMGSGPLYMGYDCAESIDGDFAAVCVIRALGDEVEIVEPYYFPKGTPIEDQLDLCEDFAKRYAVRKLVSDNAGIGRHPTSILQKRLGESRVVAFDPTLPSKGEMCTKVKRYFQNGKVRMRADKAVADDFLSIDRVITPSGNIVYQSVRSGNGGHGDMFSAFAMALTAVPESSNPDILAVESDRSSELGETPEPRDGTSIRDRIRRNRKLDEIAKKRFTM